MVGVSPFYLLCTALFLCFSDCFVLSQVQGRNEQNPVNSPDKNDSPNQKYPFAKGYYSYFVQVNELTNGYIFKPEIKYDVPNEHEVMLEPIKQFCQPSENPSVCDNFSAQQTQTGIVIVINDDLRTKIFNDSVAIFRLKAVNSTEQTKSNVGGETTVLIKIEQSFHVTDTILKFDHPTYTINIAYGRQGEIFKFQAKMVALHAEDNNRNTKQSNDEGQLKEQEYEFNGTYALEYLPAGVSLKLTIDKNGTLIVMGEINEGYYAFDVIASDYGPNSTTTLVGRSTVYLFVDRVAVCSLQEATFIKAFTKDYMQEEIKLQTVIPATSASSNCAYCISKQFPSGDFFQIDPATGAVNVVNPVDRESSVFEGMDEPSVFLEVRADCLKTDEPKEISPFVLPLDYIVYDPKATIVQLIIDDVNDNPPMFPEKRMTVGYPVAAVASAVMPKYLVQVKATDKDAGKHAKIRYLLRSNDSEDFLINSDTGIIYCTRLEEDVKRIKLFEVLAKDTDDNKEGGGLESVLTVTVMPLTYEHIIRVFAKFDVTEDAQSLETQLSDISGYKVISLTHDILNVPHNQMWLLERVMYVYGLNKDGSLVPASDLEKNLKGNDKIRTMETYYTQAQKESTEESSGMSIVYTLLFCTVVSLVALGLFYYGLIKNGRYLSCISSSATTPLKDDVENMSQSNWITTFNRSNLSPRPSSRTRLSGSNVESTSRSNNVDQSSDASFNLDAKLSFDDDLFKTDKTEDDNSVFAANDDRTFVAINR